MRGENNSNKSRRLKMKEEEKGKGDKCKSQGPIVPSMQTI